MNPIALAARDDPSDAAETPTASADTTAGWHSRNRCGRGSGGRSSPSRWSAARSRRRRRSWRRRRRSAGRAVPSPRRAGAGRHPEQFRSHGVKMVRPVGPAVAENVSGSDDHPVVMIDQKDAIGFCEWLSKKEELSCRLPTDQPGFRNPGRRGRRTTSEPVPTTVRTGQTWRLANQLAAPPDLLHESCCQEAYRPGAPDAVRRRRRASWGKHSRQ